MMIRDHRPFCNVTLNGNLHITALLDTGCTSNLSANTLLHSQLPSGLSYKNRKSGPWIGQLNCDRVQLNSLKIGSKTIAAPVFDVFPAEEAANAASEIILGNNFLSKFKSVTFDYPTRRVIFESN
jgi:hypothetical protein